MATNTISKKGRTQTVSKPKEILWSFHPGVFVQLAIEDNKITIEELARRMQNAPRILAAGFTETDVIEKLNIVIAEKELLSEDLIDGLNHAFKASESYWRNLQARYLRDEETLTAQREVASVAKWLAAMPIAFITKHIAPIASKGNDKLDKQFKATTAYFGVKNKDEFEAWKEKRCLAFRKQANDSEKSEMARAAWVRFGERYAENIVESGAFRPFNKALFEENLAEIQLLTNETPEVYLPQIKNKLAECGVIFVLAPQIPSASAYGVTWWKENKYPILQITPRRLTDDQFWFTLFHEAAHLLLHRPGENKISYEGENDEAEKEADELTIRLLTPKFELVDVQDAQNWNEAQMRFYAEKMGVSPSIIIGRLQHLKIIDFNQFNHLKKKLTYDMAQKVLSATD